MNNRFNIALVPHSKSQQVVQIAQLFSPHADRYLLDNHSLPHVTLYQFNMSEHAIPLLWEQLQKNWSIKSVPLMFDTLSCVESQQINYVSLIPDQQLVLHQLHAVVANVLKYPLKKNFEPHMTLFSTQNKIDTAVLKQMITAFLPLQDDFVLSLGRCDAVGQFTEALY